MTSSNGVEVHLGLEKALLSYLQHVQVLYHELPHIPKAYFEIVKDFQSKSIDVSGLINRVSTLFQGDLETLMGFIMALPAEYSFVGDYRKDTSYSIGQLVGPGGSLVNGGDYYGTVQNQSLPGQMGVNSLHSVGVGSSYVMKAEETQVHVSPQSHLSCVGAFTHSMEPSNLHHVNVSMNQQDDSLMEMDIDPCFGLQNLSLS